MLKEINIPLAFNRKLITHDDVYLHTLCYPRSSTTIFFYFDSEDDLIVNTFLSPFNDNLSKSILRLLAS